MSSTVVVINWNSGDLLRTCIDMFLTDSPRQLAVLRAALDGRDAAAVACAAHAIKGAVGVFSKGVAYSAARPMRMPSRCAKTSSRCITSAYL